MTSAGVAVLTMGAAVLFLCSPPAAAGADRLYLLAGTPAFGADLPVHLYSVDPAGGGPARLEKKISEAWEIGRVDRGRYVLVPRSDASIGHGSYRVGKLFAPYITELLKVR